MRENMLTSLNMKFSSSIHLPEGSIISFFFMVEENFILCMYHIFLIHSSVVEHLSYLQSLTVINSAAINMGVQVSLSYPRGHSLKYMSRSGIPV
jgi:hypothetical protein